MILLPPKSVLSNSVKTTHKDVESAGLIVISPSKALVLCVLNSTVIAGFDNNSAFKVVGVANTGITYLSTYSATSIALLPISSTFTDTPGWWVILQIQLLQ